MGLMINLYEIIIMIYLELLINVFFIKYQFLLIINIL